MPCHFRQFNRPPLPPTTPPPFEHPTLSLSFSLKPRSPPCSTNVRPWLAPTLASSKRGQSTERAEDDPHPLAATLPTTATQYRFITHPAPPTTQPPFSPSLPLFLSLSIYLSLSPRFNPRRTPHFAPLTSLRSYHGDETRTPTNFYCYFSRRFL